MIASFEISAPLRASLVVSAMLVALTGLFGRLCFLQVLRHDDYLEKAERQHSSIVEVAGRRGSIRSADGAILAVQVPSYDLAIDPQAAGENLDLRLSQIADLLGRPAAELRAELEPFLDKRYRPLAKDLNDRQLGLLRGLENSRGHLPRGLILKRSVKRVYPQGQLAAALCGFWAKHDGRGASGLELALESVLAGRPGKQLVKRDTRGVQIGDETTEWLVQPVDGADVTLTVNLKVQVAAESAVDAAFVKWKPKSVISVVIDVQNGDVLALASRPTFDPNDYGESEPESWKVRAVTDVFEPGSTFKSFILAAALDQKSVSLDTVFDCENGRWGVFRRTLRDVHPSGRLSVRDILVESSNIGTAKVALSLCGGPTGDTTPAKQIIERYLTQYFAFGQSTKIGIPGELSGMVKPAGKWGNQTLTSVPMGYEVMVTPLQLAAGYATLAAGGVRHIPRVIADITARDGENPIPEKFLEMARPRVGVQVIDMIDPLRDVRKALADVVERGTAKNVSKLSTGYRMGGKTGTTHKVDPNTGSYANIYISSFVGIAPIEDPRFVCLVIVDEPQGSHYGGTVAAPAVRDILDATLRAMPPDFPPPAHADANPKRPK